MTILTVDEAFDTLARGATLVTRSRRLSRHLRFSYDLRQQSRGIAVWETPDVLPWGAWLNRAYSRLVEGADKPETFPTVLSPAQDAALWETVIGRSLLNNSNHLLDLRAAARQARSARELLLEWAGEHEEIDWNATADTDAFHFWHTRYRRELKDNKWIDEAGIPDRLLAAKPAAWIDKAQPVLLAGFDEYTPREQRLIARLSAARVQVCEVRTRSREHAEVERLIALRDTNDEVDHAARWSLALLERGESGPIAVVVPELSRLRARVEHVFTDVLGSTALFNISLGRPLAEYPIIAAALRAVSLAAEEIPIRAAGSVLRSPFFEAAETEMAARARADTQLRRSGTLTTSRRLLAREAAPLFRAALARFETVLSSAPARQSPARWAATFSRLLHGLGWPGERKRTSAEYQAAGAWADLLSQFARLSTIMSSMTVDEALRSLADMAREAEWQPQADPAPVQILGVLETSGFDFEHLLVLGLHDGIWPAPPRPHPFIPYAAQRRFGMPHATTDRELAFARATTDRLRTAARDVTFTWPRWEADQELRPSALLAALPAAMRPMQPAAKPVALVTLEQFEDDRGPEFTGSVQRGGARVLQDMAACPFRAFAVHRLGAKPLEEPTFGPDARDRGTLVHAALRNLGCEREPSRGQVEAAVRAAIEANKDEMGIGPQLAALEQERLTELLERWFALEQTRLAAYRIVSQEAERNVVIGGLELGVRMDRVDELADGRHVILDYKTGEPKMKQWETERPEDPQLLIYAVTHDRPVAAVAFAQIRADGIRYEGIARDVSILPGIGAMPEEEWNAYLDDRKRVLTELAQGFRSGDARIDPKNGRTCDRCELTPVCRIKESELVAGAV
ncbi:MAG TPA: PD-(D/E)XK nuclease family protein [Bryobacteraceae bacterium]|nr:PD-(D/E)XK nuclease family protein [Bryobacteraceae bacterium]